MQKQASKRPLENPFFVVEKSILLRTMTPFLGGVIHDSDDLAVILD
ncbi:MAG: hypothetical protein PHI65_01780 [Firmicutes bacterium]|nr:hypothetical protein [Bacillota bacterium]